MNKFKIITLISIIFVIVAAGVIYALRPKPGNLITLENKGGSNIKAELVQPGHVKEGTENNNTFVVEEHGFSFTFPRGYYTEKEISGMCLPGTNKPSGTSSYFAPANSLVPITFVSEDISNYSNGEFNPPLKLIFVGHFNAPVNCDTNHSAASLMVFEKDNSFKNLSAYVDKKVLEQQSNQSGSLTGFIVQKVSDIRRNILTMRVMSYNSAQSTTDTLFFEDTKHIYELTINYSNYMASMTPRERAGDSYAEDEYVKYLPSKEVVQNFSTSELNATNPLLESIYLDDTMLKFTPATETEYMQALMSDNPERLEYTWENKCWELNNQKESRACIETKAFKSSPSGIARRKNDCLFITTKVGEKKFCDPKFDYMIASDGVEYPYSFYGVLPNGLIMVREQHYESSSIHLVNPADGEITEVYASPIPYTFKSSPIIISYYLNSADGPHGLVQIHEYKNKTLSELYSFNPERWALMSPRRIDGKTFIWEIEDDYDPSTEGKYIRMDISDL